MIRRVVYLIFSALLLQACGGSVIPSDPIREMKKEFTGKLAYTILLADMDLQQEQYRHKYTVLEITKDGKVEITTTEWKDVSDDFFVLNDANLGMELLSKKPDGKYNNLVTPPGFTNFVGNPNYGSWVRAQPAAMTTTDVATDSLIWAFHPEYAYLGPALGIANLPISKNEYENFGKKYLFNRPYYGDQLAKDTTRYGTYSRHWVYLRPDFYTRRVMNHNFTKIYPDGSNSFDRGGGGPGK